MFMHYIANINKNLWIQFPNFASQLINITIMIIESKAKNNTMVDNGHHELIKGEFLPEEALDILYHLISAKINFHDLRSFSKLERFGIVDEAAAIRIKELKESRESIKELIHEATAQGKTLRISSNISIELI
jgi:hypothetical protein